jgi:malate dehydrogenase
MVGNLKVTLVGAAGGIGQPLSLLLKALPGIGELSLIDIGSSPIKGVAVDLSHVNTDAVVKGFVSPDELGMGLEGSSIVLVTAGCMTLKPGMSRDSLFDSSAKLISSIAEACSKACPDALFAIVTNPVNSMVPIFVETLRSHGVSDPGRRVFGVTSLDVVRASTFVSQTTGTDPKMTHVPVIGGHGGESILALVSRTQPACKLSGDTMSRLERRIMDAAFEVVNAKNGAGSATLSMAYAASLFCRSLVQALITGKMVKDYGYVCVEGLPLVDGFEPEDRYFGGLCHIGPAGVVSIDPLPVDVLTDYERSRLKEAKAKCRNDVAKAFEFLRI